MLPQKYVIAVSGGVDSVVLLDMLATRKPPGITYIVAHFDHGIRNDSKKDLKLVRKLSKNYDLNFIAEEGNLGQGASEETARDARYAFLRKIKNEFKAEKIIMAHHQDDLLETMVLNMLRGTSPRGLAPMQGHKDILRPLMNKRKSELLQYANNHKLEWHDDSTNRDEKYLRNYVRSNIMPKLEDERDYLLSLNKKIEKLYIDIDLRIESLLYGQKVLYRPKYVVLPYVVQLEMTRAWLMKAGVGELDRKTIERITNAIKTLAIGKKTDIDGHRWLQSEKQNVLITSK